MKTRTIAALALAGLLPTAGFAQTPPTPATPATPAVPAVPAVPATPASPSSDDKSDRPKVPITYLGVETSELPGVVADQLGLPKGFGLVVDYVVADGPAAAAGLQQHDILRMLNDQILMEPDQLSKLIRSYPEGTTVTLTVLRKGAETKLTARLGKKEVPQRRQRDKHWHHGPNMGQIGPDMEKLSEELRNLNIPGAAATASAFVNSDEIQREIRQAQREARREAREAQREVREAQREAAREAREARRAARGFRFSYGDDGRLKSTRIDMNKAQIVYHDDKGELKIEHASDGKKVLTAKDPQGRTVFSGPVGTPEELQKLPPDVRARYDKLEQKDLPAIAPSMTGPEKTDEQIEADDDDNDSEAAPVDVLQVKGEESTGFPYRRLGINTILI